MISYLIKESFRGFRNAKFSAIASIFTISLSIILIAVYLNFSLNSSKLIRSIKEKVELEVFLDDDITADELKTLREKIRTIGGIKQISYISKDSAMKIFAKDFGSEMLEIFESNPLPASFKINLYDEYKSVERVNKIKNQILNFKDVNDVVFPQKNLELIDSNTSGYLFINLILIIVISLSAIFLVSNTIRLVISGRKNIIETLKLLGAKRSFIKFPFLLEGIIQGFLGSIFAVIILYLIYLYFKHNFSQSELKIEFIGFDYLIYLVLIGVFLGAFGSLLSLRRFLKTKFVINQ